MAGTKEGAAKAVKTNLERHGADFYARIGKKGGEKGHTGGFASMTPARRSACGRKGGLISTRKGIKNGQGKSKLRDRKKPVAEAEVEVKKRRSIFPWRNK